MRRNRLFILTFLMLVPSIGAVLIAAFGVFHFQKTLETITRSYVENLAESLASRIQTRWDFIDPETAQSLYNKQPGFRTFAGIGTLPGLIAVLDSNGQFIYGSDSLKEILPYVTENYALATAWEIHDSEGDKYTVAIFPTRSSSYYVLAAVPWKDLPGYAVRFGYFWPTIIGCVGISGLFAVWLMWRRVILPLQDLEAEVSGLRWGEDIPGYGDSSTVYELQKLRVAFVGLARGAIERVQLTKSYVNDLVRVQEEERGRLSREIHDGVLQDVTALIQRMRLAHMEIDNCDEVRRQLSIAEGIAHATVREMRGLCDMLNPPWLELGLFQALTELTERQALQYGIRIILDIPEKPELSDDITLALFRVVQESVANSARHGRAKIVRISLRSVENGWWLEITDDGAGFDVPASLIELRAHGHRGLANMHERMALVGGHVEILSQKGEGTITRCWFPVGDMKGLPS